MKITDRILKQRVLDARTPTIQLDSIINLLLRGTLNSEERVPFDTGHLSASFEIIEDELNIRIYPPIEMGRTDLYVQEGEEVDQLPCVVGKYHWKSPYLSGEKSRERLYLLALKK